MGTKPVAVLSRELHRKGIYPPINILPSLSRLMNEGIGVGRTREDHKQLSDQLYASYSAGVDLRGLLAIVGEDAMSEEDRRHLKLADEFEKRFVGQGPFENRSIETTLGIGWTLLSALPKDELAKISPKFRDKYYPARKE